MSTPAETTPEWSFAPEEPTPEPVRPSLFARVASKVVSIEGAIALAVVVLAATFALPLVRDARRVANEETALAFMREIHAWQTAFKAKPGPDGTRGYARSFRDLAAAGIYAGPLPEGAAVMQQGYVFRIGAYDLTGESYYAVGLPAQFGDTGARSFYVDDSGAVRGSPAPVVGPAFPAVQ